MKQQKQKQKITEMYLVLTISFLSILVLSSLAIATPTGPSSITYISNTTKDASAAQMVNISGGYISKFNITATAQNPHWKAFVGDIDGKFTLDDSSGSTIYDWTLSSVEGEVYATRASGTINWGSIACATAPQITTEDSVLNSAGEDNITSTFSSTNSKTFVVAGTQITATTCASTNTYVNNVSQSSQFEEVVLHDTSNIIFATILEADKTGYDGSTYDFQMLAPENASATWTGSTPYYLYVELS